jgi:protocatechuate 3,4-dioxygenase beta subunit
MSPELNRRQAMAAFGSVSLGALLAACGGDDGESARMPTTEGATTEATPSKRTSGSLADMFEDSATCQLTTEQTEGPYYFDADAIRSDIREDRAGTPLRLAIRVRDSACEPLPDAVVDIWHCDADGAYSGFEAESGERFLRGTQVTNGKGIAEFTTVYPGWYPGRTVHIHAKVHLDNSTMLTTQLYFPEAVTEQVYTREPYVNRGGPDMRNADDGIFDEALVLDLDEDVDGFIATISFDVASEGRM